MTSNYVWFFISGTIITWFLVFLSLPYLTDRFLDNPNQRSSHTIPTPRGGGIAFVLVGTVLNLIFMSGTLRWIPVMCLPLAIIGMIDDFNDLPASIRYLFQLCTAISLVAVSNITLSVWTYIILVIVVTAIINFINFMDGLDGLVAGCGVLLIATTSNWIICGAIFGFLLWNWSPAKVFMGDVGSTYIGSVFCGLALQSHSYHELLNIFLIGFPLFADTSTCVLRRWINSQNVFKAHRQHLFQRLNMSGWSHRKVSILYITATALLLVTNTLGGLFYSLIAISGELALGLYLEANIARKFALD